MCSSDNCKVDKMEKNYNYKVKRVVCQGIVKGCDACKDKHEEGYCTLCGRPLWKKVGEPCGNILGYMDRNYKQENKVHWVCRWCSTCTTL